MCWPGAVLLAANHSCRGQAVYFGHLNSHKNKIERLPGERLNRFPAAIWAGTGECKVLREGSRRGAAQRWRWTCQMASKVSSFAVELREL
jgi:hypothetical protein